MDINASGDVAGLYVNSSQSSQSFLRTHDGTLTEFDPPDTTSGVYEGSMAFGINDAGAIVGSFNTTSQIPTKIVVAGYQRTPGGNIEPINFPGTVASDSSTYAACIDSGGEVAGYYFDSNSGQNAGFIQSSTGQFTAFVLPGATPQIGLGALSCRINATGNVAGLYFQGFVPFRSFLATADGTVTEIAAPGAGTTLNAGTLALDINASGVIVGGVVGTGSISHSFMRAADGTFTVFDPPGTGTGGSVAESINDSGVIAGGYSDANNVQHGYIRAVDGTFETVDEPNASQAANSQGTFIQRINASGAIVGHYFDAAGVEHGFVRE